MTAGRAAKDRWQALPDQATKQLRVAPVTVVLVDGSAAEYVCLEQRINSCPSPGRTLAAPSLRPPRSRQYTNEKPEVSVATLRQGI